MTREALAGRESTMWRYFEVLPVRDPPNVVTLGEGYTPLLRADRLRREIGCGPLLIKDEGVNPTASFKARGMAAAVSKAKELGVTGLTVPTAGNAGGALAAYAARAAMEAHVFMPADAPEATQKEVEVMGARLVLVDGLIGDAGAMSRRTAAEQGLFDVSTLQEPYRAEGKKTMGYEIAEQLGWRMPGVIVYPTGGGTGIVRHLEGRRGDGGHGPARRAEAAHVLRAVRGLRPPGARLPRRRRPRRALARRPDARRRHPGALRHRRLSHPQRAAGERRRRGDGLGRRDRGLDAQGRVARGHLRLPEGAATAAALAKLVAGGDVDPGEETLLLNTGSGLKYPGGAARAGNCPHS